MVYTYSVDVFQCEESGVYVGTSSDIPGLTLEADGLGGMIEAVLEMVPQLIECNLDVPANAEVQVTVRRFLSPVQHERRTTREHSQPPSFSRLRCVVEEELNYSYA